MILQQSIWKQHMQQQLHLSRFQTVETRVFGGRNHKPSMQYHTMLALEMMNENMRIGHNMYAAARTWLDSTEPPCFWIIISCNNPLHRCSLVGMAKVYSRLVVECSLEGCLWYNDSSNMKSGWAIMNYTYKDNRLHRPSTQKNLCTSPTAHFWVCFMHHMDQGYQQLFLSTHGQASVIHASKSRFKDLKWL